MERFSSGFMFMVTLFYFDILIRIKHLMENALCTQGEILYPHFEWMDGDFFFQLRLKKSIRFNQWKCCIIEGRYITFLDFLNSLISSLLTWLSNLQLLEFAKLTPFMFYNMEFGLHVYLLENKSGKPASCCFSGKRAALVQRVEFEIWKRYLLEESQTWLVLPPKWDMDTCG